MADRLDMIAADFWRDAGVRDSLAGAAEAALPVTVVQRSALSPRAVGQYLETIGIAAAVAAVGADDAPLRGCVFASRGHGVLFIRAGEELFTLAHEIAHFLLHYHLPRHRATWLAGREIVAVLDGDRAATPAERLTGALTGVSIGPHVHLLGTDHEPAAETEADALAARLLGDRPTPRRDPLLAWARAVLIGGRP